MEAIFNGLKMAEILIVSRNNLKNKIGIHDRTLQKPDVYALIEIFSVNKIDRAKQFALRFFLKNLHYFLKSKLYQYNGLAGINRN